MEIVAFLSHTHANWSNEHPPAKGLVSQILKKNNFPGIFGPRKFQGKSC